MSRSKIRIDKTCLNCNHVVAERFCPNCGQENTDSRKSFHELFFHFFEDLTHYENSFWKTIRNLLFKPSALTKEYLSGKRMSYLAPIRLYIFISFLTFFLIAVLPGKNIKDSILQKEKKEASTNKNISIKKHLVIGKEGIGNTNDDFEDEDDKNEYYNYDSIKAVEDAKKEPTKEEKEIQQLLKNSKVSKSTKDTILSLLEKSKVEKEAEDGFINFGYNSIEELDSVQKYGKEEDKEDAFTYWITKKTLQVKKENTKEQIIETGIASAKSNFPKVLLIYMPIFALLLWLFHSKKRWYYFDHGIFTLHYFSFLLLINLIMFVLRKLISSCGENQFISVIEIIISFVGYLWMFYYFYPAHHRFYGETRIVSFIKSSILFFINMIFIIILLVAFFLYTLVTIH
ncbi:MAG: DUF3667 domain-containing protein [Flavobacterium sp.]|uniref:DUF3667 domain-containing protein n=1 Tax=Flavobacterium sp. TaxID=239 RepID=UPI0022C3BE7B|nr:DUF3667 domain-containing protein [Flavobacterium sp.]MCZ8197015.1 DUF3667 domain-containing protein [Flavobacterium sp.]